MKQTTIIIADDHPLIRKAWGFLINQDPRFKVIAETESGEAAVELTRQLRPDIVILEIDRTEISGLLAIQLMRKYSPGSKIIGLSFHVFADYVHKVIQMGASGFLTKNSSIKEIFEAIAEVQIGKTYICHEVKNILS